MKILKWTGGILTRLILRIGAMLLFIPLKVWAWLASRFENRPFWVRATLVAMIGVIVGLGFFTFVYAGGFSYLSSDPESCANCHIMQDVYDGWNKSSHKAVAACADCHAPHDIVKKYAVKGINGVNHTLAFTFNTTHEPIQITSFNRQIVQDQCVYCHKELVQPISYESSEHPPDCLRCHARVGHDY
jgi:cytochrome c nitrite reductase small subunit